jgi:hypothetical protein
LAVKILTHFTPKLIRAAAMRELNWGDGRPIPRSSGMASALKGIRVISVIRG